MLQEFQLENIGTLRIHTLPLSTTVDEKQSSLINVDGKFKMQYHTSLKDICVVGHMFRDTVLPFVGIKETV